MSKNVLNNIGLYTTKQYEALETRVENAETELVEVRIGTAAAVLVGTGKTSAELHEILEAQRAEAAKMYQAETLNVAELEAALAAAKARRSGIAEVDKNLAAAQKALPTGVEVDLSKYTVKADA